MGFIGLFSVFTALVFMGAGLALGALAAVVAACLLLVATGTLVTIVSLGMGWWRGDARMGMWAFLLQAGFCAGMAGGGLATWLGWHLWPVLGDDVAVIAFGAGAGAILGLALAWTSGVCLVRLRRILTRRIRAMSRWLTGWSSEEALVPVP